jgi:hypothetical protein
MCREGFGFAARQAASTWQAHGNEDVALSGCHPLNEDRERTPTMQTKELRRFTGAIASVAAAAALFVAAPDWDGFHIEVTCVSIS